MKSLSDKILKNLKLVFRIIPKRLRKEYIIISALSVFLAFVEFLGVAMLLPFFNEITNTAGVTYLQLYNLLFSQHLELTASQSIIFSLSSVLILLVLKNSVSAFILFNQYRFGSKIQASVSENLFLSYLRSQYSEIINKNSADLIRNSITETNKLNEFIVLPSFFLVTDLILFGSVIVFLLVSETVASLIIFSTIGILYGTSIFFIGRKITLWGKLRFEAEGQRIKSVQEGLGAFINIKLRDLAENYLNKYRKPNNSSAYYGFLQNATQQIPKNLLEVLIFASLLLLIAISAAFTNISNKEILSILGLFAIASYKLLPTISRITGTIQSIRFYKPSMDVFQGLTGHGNSHNQKKQNLTFNDTLSIENLWLSYGDHDLLKDINISINKGDTVGITGKSGSGKTTLAHCIMGLIKPTQGQITKDKIDIQADIVAWMNLIGYVPQTVFLLDDTIQNNITLNFDSEPVDMDILKLAIAQAGLTDWINSLPNGFVSHVGERGNKISGGQLQRIGIARALYRNPEILVFDESTSALDSRTEQEFIETIETLKKDKTILFITHKRAPLKICDKIFRIESGSIHIQKNNISI